MTFSSLAVASVALSILPAALANGVSKRNYTPQFPPCTTPYVPFQYVGCYNDPTGATLPFSPQIFLDKDNMTVEKCTAACKANGFKYAGLEYYGQCRCGTAISGTAATDQCTYACTGDATEVCGGSNLISIYVDPTYPTVDLTNANTGYVSLGCYNEISGRALSLPQDDLSQSGTVTQELCISRCASIGAAYAGVENGNECYCGGELGPNSNPADTGNCNIPCVGPNTSNELCGGANYLEIFYNAALYGQACSPASSSVPVPTTSASTTPIPTTSSIPPPPPTTTTPPANTTPTTTPTSAPPPPSSTNAPPTSTCIATCGNYCQPPLPTYTDKPTCWQVATQCWKNVKDCQNNAGYQYTGGCKAIAAKCARYSTYCKNKCNGGGVCNKGDCDSNWYGPPGPAPAPVQPTYVPPPSTPTYTQPAYGICATPAAYANPVGGYKPPQISCNNNYQDYNSGNCFKVFYNKYSQAPSYTFPRYSASKACTTACQMQFYNCKNQYAVTCISRRMGRRAPQEEHEIVARTFGWFWPWLNGGVSDNYMSALYKCQQQRNACIQANQWNNGGGHCSKYGSY